MKKVPARTTEKTLNSRSTLRNVIINPDSSISSNHRTIIMGALEAAIRNEISPENIRNPKIRYQGTRDLIKVHSTISSGEECNLFYGILCVVHLDSYVHK